MLHNIALVGFHNHREHSGLQRTWKTSRNSVSAWYIKTCMFSFGSVTDPTELESSRRAVETFKCFFSALFTAHLGLSPCTSPLLYPPHTLYNSQQSLEVQCCLNSKHLPPNYFSLLVHRAEILHHWTTEFIRQQQAYRSSTKPFAAEVCLCGGSIQTTLQKKQRGWFLR